MLPTGVKGGIAPTSWQQPQCLWTMAASARSYASELLRRQFLGKSELMSPTVATPRG